MKEYLYENIPIAKALGVEYETATTDKVVIRAPLSNNINHKKTVFGGSLHAIATLSCWSLLYCSVKDHEIVITESNIRYLAPVTSDFTATCKKPPQDAWNRFLKTLKKRGKARIDLESTIYQGDTLAVSFSGTFAAFLPKLDTNAVDLLQCLVHGNPFVRINS